METPKKVVTFMEPLVASAPSAKVASGAITPGTKTLRRRPGGASIGTAVIVIIVVLAVAILYILVQLIRMKRTLIKHCEYVAQQTAVNTQTQKTLDDLTEKRRQRVAQRFLSIEKTPIKLETTLAAEEETLETALAAEEETALAAEETALPIQEETALPIQEEMLEIALPIEEALAASAAAAEKATAAAAEAQEAAMEAREELVKAEEDEDACSVASSQVGSKPRRGGGKKRRQPARAVLDL